MTQSHRGQQGATLIITMIFLVIITLLGLNTIQNTSLEEKMAANLRFKDQVFQEAEAVLRVAEDDLSVVTLESFVNSNGLYSEFFPDFSRFAEGASWGVDSWKMSDTNSSDVQSGYVVQEIPILGLEDSLEVGVGKDSRKLYTITARAISLHTGAKVVLQTTFSR